jgi:hypothetical protein
MMALARLTELFQTMMVERNQLKPALYFLFLVYLTIAMTLDVGFAANKYARARGGQCCGKPSSA